MRRKKAEVFECLGFFVDWVELERVVDFSGSAGDVAVSILAVEEGGFEEHLGVVGDFAHSDVVDFPSDGGIAGFFLEVVKDEFVFEAKSLGSYKRVVIDESSAWCGEIGICEAVELVVGA